MEPPRRQPQASPSLLLSPLPTLTASSPRCFHITALPRLLQGRTGGRAGGNTQAASSRARRGPGLGRGEPGRALRVLPPRPAASLGQIEQEQGRQAPEAAVGLREDHHAVLLQSQLHKLSRRVGLWGSRRRSGAGGRRPSAAHRCPRTSSQRGHARNGVSGARRRAMSSTRLCRRLDGRRGLLHRRAARAGAAAQAEALQAGAHEHAHAHAAGQQHHERDDPAKSLEGRGAIACERSAGRWAAAAAAAA